MPLSESDDGVDVHASLCRTQDGEPGILVTSGSQCLAERVCCFDEDSKRLGGQDGFKKPSFTWVSELLQVQTDCCDSALAQVHDLYRTDAFGNARWPRTGRHGCL